MTSWTTTPPAMTSWTTTPPAMTSCNDVLDYNPTCHDNTALAGFEPPFFFLWHILHATVKMKQGYRSI